MTNNTEVNGRAKVCERSAHRASLRLRGRCRFPLVMMFLTNREFFVRSVKTTIQKIAVRQIATHPTNQFLNIVHYSERFTKKNLTGLKTSIFIEKILKSISGSQVIKLVLFSPQYFYFSQSELKLVFCIKILEGGSISCLFNKDIYF